MGAAGKVRSSRYGVLRKHQIPVPYHAVTLMHIRWKERPERGQGSSTAGTLQVSAVAEHVATVALWHSVAPLLRSLHG